METTWECPNCGADIYGGQDLPCPECGAEPATEIK